jgi:antitoxin (DNA-binding transcriptional repressor) of toxin-antitoxin stability system
MHETQKAAIVGPVILGDCHCPKTFVLTCRGECVTMSHMKEISLRELHRRTGQWVRSARRYGSILVRDRATAVAKIVPVTEEPAINRFRAWKPLKRFADALDQPIGGKRVADIISEDRER